MDRKKINIGELTFSPICLLRTPAFPLAGAGMDKASILRMPFFRSAIRVASKSLYHEMKKAGFDWEQMNESTHTSLWRYMNRMQFRPTPFGLCASISAVRWKTRPIALVLHEKCSFHVWQDFKITQESVLHSMADNCFTKYAYTTNPALYRVMDNYRYLSYETSEKGNRSFVISEADASATLEDILQFCKEPFSYAKILSRLRKLHLFTEEAAGNYAHQMIQSGILVPDQSLQVNITGKDYLLRTTHQRQRRIVDPELFTDAADELYVITERPVKSGGLDTDYQKKIRDGLACLLRLNQPMANSLLDEFKKKFREKYDRQRIPLLKALDPELGIGYNSGLSPAAKPALLPHPDVGADEVAISPITWSATHSLLLNKWLSNSDRYAPITLTQQDLDTLPPASCILPNSFSVVFRVTCKRLVLEQAGGATGTALSGRFTLANKTILKNLRGIAGIEAAANPGVVFAEIAHIEEAHTANIDRREHIYSYEIPILCGSLLPADRQIALSELSVFMVDDELVLWSERLQKRVIPRLSSAYNYQRSEFSVFRFLCDLQHQGLLTAMSVDLSQWFPDQHFYPRVMYEGVILHLATWVIEQDVVNRLAVLPIDERVVLILEIAAQCRWPDYIALNKYDHQLVFNRNDPDHCRQLALEFTAGRQLVVKEFLRDNDKPTTRDAMDQSYVNQFVATMYHQQKVYSAVHPAVQQTSVQRRFVPGSEWLYYKLYVHEAASNQILADHIQCCTRQLRVQGLIRKWFFVRYADPGYHLRIRLLLHPKHIGYALVRFENVLQQLAQSGIIQRYHVDTYDREIERYGDEMIAACEDFFCHSTALILAWMDKITADDATYDYYYIAAWSMRIMAEAFMLSGQETIDFFKRLYEEMAGERTKNKAHNNNMKQKFREVNMALSGKKGLHDKTASLLKKPLKQFNQSLAAITMRMQAWPSARRLQLLADLVHMHLNRLLVSDSRNQEMMLYYYCYRWLESERARKRSGLPVAADQVIIDPL